MTVTSPTVSSSISMGAAVGKRKVLATGNGLGHAVKGRMFSIQADLPRLPVPPLQQTLDKYLKTIKPITSEVEFNHTQQVGVRCLTG